MMTSIENISSESETTPVPTPLVRGSDSEQTKSQFVDDKVLAQPLILTKSWVYQLRSYAEVLMVTIVLYAIFSVYLYYRRGYYDLYITNKIIAGVAAVLLGFVLLIGPMSRLFSFADRLIKYRKELGFVAFFLSLIHGIVSLFFLPSKFPLSSFLRTVNWPFFFGLGALIILFTLFSISNSRTAAVIGRLRWWKLQYFGVRLSFVLILLHVLIMKWKGWVEWYQVGGGRDLVRPEWPGAGLLVGWFMSFVMLVRLAELGGKRLGRAVAMISIIALSIIYITTFWWGRQFIQ
ncbi:hypothetical protein HY408_00830 [Candidatus Gottesmanbacteria bacterium]|nr:hypothetical protein [Candidatus Gottesmanbacteria bacterium]